MIDKLPNQRPISYRERKPRIHTIRIMNERPDGLPDGVHCGAWLDIPTKEVWKSLYGRPYVNAEHIYRTREVEFLAIFADKQLFPKNWRVERSNNLEWLVRKEAFVLKKNDYETLENKTLLIVEQTVRKVNEQGWALNDYITLLIDKETGLFFIGDLSTVNQDTHADDELYITRFFELCNKKNLIKLRENGKHILHELHYSYLIDTKPITIDNYLPPNIEEYKHIYASFNRPINGLWASLPNVIYKHESAPNWSHDVMIPWTWVISKEPLPDDKIYSYELTWAWSPIR